MPSFPKSEVQALLRRAGGPKRPASVPQRHGAPRSALPPSDDSSSLLEVFVPGLLPNPLNGPVGFWPQRARLRKDWRERTHQALFVGVHERYGALGLAALPAPGAPKRIQFTLYVGQFRDDDSLGPCVKPCRDACVDAKLISGDGPKDGHQFEYAQERRADIRGVGIAISLLPTSGDPL